MCGIFGYVGSRDVAPSVVLGGLKKLEYRGYDSWGIAIQQNGHVTIDKRVGKITDATTDLPPSAVGLGHTRWATHGGVTTSNAHPHLDCGGRLAVIHNGIIDNYRVLKRDLEARGHRFTSETDSEVVAHLIEAELDGQAADPERTLAALLATFRQLEGMNAVAVLDAQAGVMVAAKSGSPLVLGSADGASYLASDPLALLEYTRNITFLEDGQVALLGAGSVRIFDVGTGHERPTVVQQIGWRAEEADLNGYPNFMLKEMEEQPRIVRQIADGPADDIRRLARLIQDADRLFFVGCGTAAHAAMAGQYLLARLAARPVTSVIGSEFGYLEEILTERDLVVAFSQSGETIDVLDAVRLARARGAQVAALVNVEGSSLYRLADLPVLLGAGPERCVLATKSFTAKLANILLVAHELANRLDDGRALLHRAADEIESILHDGRRETIHQLAADVAQQEHLFVIGRGPSYPLALEAALKIKEVSYLHAEGLAGGELKHGVIALIEPGTTCLVLAPRDETYHASIAGAMEVAARGGLIVGISSEHDEAFDLHLPVADVGIASLLVEAIPPQLLAYDLALLRGYDPDKPRNLAKSVTVR